MHKDDKTHTSAVVNKKELNNKLENMDDKRHK